MGRAVKIENNIVCNIIRDETAEMCANFHGGEWVDDHDGSAGMGFIYDTETNTYKQTDEQVDFFRNMALSNLRTERDYLLNETDKYMVTDFPITEEKKQEILTYRQSLRDLPANTPDPMNVAWPTPPS
jgi:hypothetical protein